MSRSSADDRALCALLLSFHDHLPIYLRAAERRRRARTLARTDQLRAVIRESMKLYRAGRHAEAHTAFEAAWPLWDLLRELAQG